MSYAVYKYFYLLNNGGKHTKDLITDKMIWFCDNLAETEPEIYGNG